ncbi:MAG: cbb3-type cytochrome c oxidase subunit II, partial [Acidobacteriaceae bacterium]
GIGMGQHLGHIPPLFVAFAAAVILLPLLLRARRRELLATAAVLLVAACAWATQRVLTPTPAPLTQIQRGRQVYISEGCINCHSQYVRPNTRDVALYGPPQTLAELRAQNPPLIGNRRQGPDLTNVALRRSPRWLRAHLIDPRSLSPKSIMPSYAYLFRNHSQQGNDLLAYLETLHPTPPNTNTGDPR